jgi:hypothetical protein
MPEVEIMQGLLLNILSVTCYSLIVFDFWLCHSIVAEPVRIKCDNALAEHSWKTGSPNSPLFLLLLSTIFFRNLQRLEDFACFVLRDADRVGHHETHCFVLCASRMSTAAVCRLLHNLSIRPMVFDASLYPVIPGLHMSGSGESVSGWNSLCANVHADNVNSIVRSDLKIRMISANSVLST